MVLLGEDGGGSRMISSERMEQMLDEADFDLLIAASPENVFYTSGMHSIATSGLGETAFSLWSAESGGPYLVMPARETSSLIDNNVDPAGIYPYGTTNIYQGDVLSATDQRVLELQEARDFDDPVSAVSAAIHELTSGKRIGIERDAFDPDNFAAITEALDDYELVAATDHIYGLRRMKTEEEIRRLRRAAKITETSMNEAMANLEPGMTEQDLANDFRARVCERGAEPLFLTVSFGDRTAYTHPLPSDREIREGDLVRWDGGCTFENYSSDIGRTFAFQSADTEFERKYDALHAGLEAALDEIGDGVNTGTVYDEGVAAVRSSGVEALANFEPFHLGHGIGIEIYDPPTIAPDAGQIAADMVMCVEPPYNELGHGGFLIEDEILVTEDGYERLTQAAETLPIVG